MLKNLLEFLNNILLLAPEEDREIFARQLRLENRNRLKLLLIPVALIVLIFLVLENLAQNHLLFKLHIGLLALVLISGFYLFTHFKSGQEAKFALSGSVIILGWAAAAAGLAEATGLYLVNLIFLSLLFASFIYFNWYFWLAVLAGSYTLYLILSLLQGSGWSERSIFILAGLAAAWFYSRIIFFERVKKFKATRLLKARLAKKTEKTDRLQDILLEKNEEREELEDQLQEYRKIRDFIQYGSDTGYWQWDLADNRVDFDRNWALMLGYHVDRLKGRLETWRDLVHPGDRKEIEKKLESCRQGEIEEFRAEQRLRSSSGDWTWFKTGVQLERDQEDEPCLIRGVNRKITDLKSRERQINTLRQSQEQFLDSLPFLLMIYQQQQWVFINQAAVDLTGYSRSRLEEKNFSELVHPRFRDLINKSQNKVDDHYQLQIVTREGQEKWIELLPRKGEFRGEAALIITAVDIDKFKGG